MADQSKLALSLIDRSIDTLAAAGYDVVFAARKSDGPTSLRAALQGDDERQASACAALTSELAAHHELALAEAS